MKFNRNLIKLLALYLIFLLSVQNAYVISLTTTSHNKSAVKRLYKNSSSKNTNTKTNSKNKIPIFSKVWNYACSFFSCSRVDKESTKKLLNQSVDLKDALVLKIIQESKYFEKDLKDFSLMKISVFLGVLPPHLLQEPYASVIQQYVYCFLDKEIANEKNRLTEKMVKGFRSILILRRFYKKLKKRISVANESKEKKGISKLVTKIASLDVNQIQEKLLRMEKDSRDPQNQTLVKFLARTSLLLQNEKSKNIPSDTKLLSFIRANDEFLDETKAQFLTQFSQCKSETLKTYLSDFPAKNLIYDGVVSDKLNSVKNLEILQEIEDELKFIETGVRSPNAKKKTSPPRKDNEPIEYSSDIEELKNTGKERMLAISETLDLIAEKSKQIKDISQQAADTLKDLKEAAKMIKDTKDFLRNSDLVKDYKEIKAIIHKLDGWKLTKDENLDKIEKVLGKYESKILSVSNVAGKVYNFSKTASDIVKEVKSLSLNDRPSVLISKTLILGANIASIVPGLSSYKFAIEVAKFTGESIRDSPKLQKLIDDLITESVKEFEYSLGKGLLPFSVIVTSDFGMDSGNLDKYTFDDVKQEIKDISQHISESANNFVKPIVQQIENDIKNNQIDRYTVINGGDFAMDFISYEKTSDNYEKGITSYFSNWFTSSSTESGNDSNSNDSWGNWGKDSDNGSSNNGSGGSSGSSSSSSTDFSSAESTFEFNGRAGNNPFERKKKKL